VFVGPVGFADEIFPMENHWEIGKPENWNIGKSEHDLSQFSQ
jgi:hypothetical protein